MKYLTYAQLQHCCLTLLGMIEAGIQPRPDAGVCANLDAVAGLGMTGGVLRKFFVLTGRDSVYPIEEQMYPALNDDEWEGVYHYNVRHGLVWMGEQRAARIALLNEFIEWLEDNK